MSPENSSQGDHDPHGPKRFNFAVDGRQFESAEAHLTGLQIKSIGGVDASFGLFLEGRGHGSDQPIADGEIVDLSAPGKEMFYSAPAATYGGAGFQ
jgi:hypothetical protein